MAVNATSPNLMIQNSRVSPLKESLSQKNKDNAFERITSKFNEKNDQSSSPTQQARNNDRADAKQNAEDKRRDRIEARNSKSENKFNEILEKPSSSTSARDARSESTNVDRPSKRNEDLKGRAETQNLKSKQIQPASRQAAMEVFLQQMNDVVGVKPENVIEAFASLTPADLTASPEESAEKVISALGLSDGKKDKALALYNEMLAMTAAAGMAGYLETSGQTANVKVMSADELRRNELNASLDRMNDKFFMNGDYQSSAAMKSAQGKQAYSAAQNAQMMTPSQEAMAQAQTNSQYESAEVDPFATSGLNNSEINPNTGVTQSVDPNSANDMSSLAVDQNPRPEHTKLTNMYGQEVTPEEYKAAMENGSEDYAVEDAEINSLPAWAKKPNPSLDTKTTKVLSESAQNPIVGLTAATQAPIFNKMEVPSLGSESAGATQMTAGQGVGLAGVDQSDNEQGSDSTGDQANPDIRGQHQLSSLKNDSIHGKQSFQLNVPQPTEADVQNNVKEIISQAQFLAKKGGGEMKVSLSPDGIGQLNLKVKMIKGQVNVEMITSNDEAKKILERGLSDLKESLASHKLHLDSIKIENTRDISNQLQDQRQDLERQFQQKFLGDFREHNSGGRRELFEIGQISVPGSQTRDRAQNTSYNPGKKKPVSSRRLDLVA